MLPQRASLPYVPGSRESLAEAMIKAQQMNFFLQEEEELLLDAEQGWKEYTADLLNIYHELLKRKHMKLDAVIELRVNESALVQRVETRAAETLARGGEVRVDDTAEVLIKRLSSYRSLTEPLIHYYSEKRKLVTVDGMMSIEQVTREIARILQAIGVVETKASKKPPSAKRSARKAAPKAAKTVARGKPVAKKAAKGARKAAKPASRVAKKVAKGAVGRAAKKVTKRRVKA